MTSSSTFSSSSFFLLLPFFFSFSNFFYFTSSLFPKYITKNPNNIYFLTHLIGLTIQPFLNIISTYFSHSLFYIHQLSNQKKNHGERFHSRLHHLRG